MWDFEPDLALSENWSRAVKLHEAWFHYAPEAIKNQYRGASSKPRMDSLRELMRSYVREFAFRGELIALAIRVEPSPDTHVSKIPLIFFESDAVQFDWDNNKIRGLGHTFEDVRVLGITNANPAPTEFTAPIPSSSPKGRAGRPSNYKKACHVLQELYGQSHNYRDMSAAGILDVFNERYLSLFSPPNKRAAAVSERALRTYIIRYRQELAETGNN